MRVLESIENQATEACYFHGLNVNESDDFGNQNVRSLVQSLKIYKTAKVIVQFNYSIDYEEYRLTTSKDKGLIIVIPK